MNRMILAFASVALVGMTAGASAADIVRPPLVHQQPLPHEVYVQPLTTTNIYAGLLGGFSKGSLVVDQIDPAFKGPEPIGAFAGIVHPIGTSPFALGLQVQVAKSGQKGSLVTVYCDNLGNTYTVTTSDRIRYTGDILGQAGVLLGSQQRLFAYVTGGLGIAGGNVNMLNIGSYGNASWTADKASGSFVAYGPAFGAGVDLAIGEHAFIQAQYLHTNYSHMKVGNVSEMYDNTLGLNKLKDDQFTIGFGIRF
jgi:opacity protein-like surface antigen